MANPPTASEPPLSRIGVVGAGAWGLALAQTAAGAGAGREVLLCARDPAVVEAIRTQRRHPHHLPTLDLHPRVTPVLGTLALDRAEVLILTVPAQTVRAVASTLPPTSAPVVIGAKGFERASGATLSAVVEEVRPSGPVAVLSGPNFAGEVARGLPAATVLGCTDANLGRRLSEALSSARFRVYWTDDRLGVEIGGALKNVLAIAAGIVSGLGLGENARAGLMARGLAEMTRFGTALGARATTLTGLSGLGDLVLTAMSLTSRNTAFGFALGEGGEPKDLLASGTTLVEGVFTTGAVRRRAKALGIEMPIVDAVDDILEGRMRANEAVRALMARPLRPEGNP